MGSMSTGTSVTIGSSTSVSGYSMSTSIGASHVIAKTTAEELIGAGDLSQFVLRVDDDICLECGHECNLLMYFHNMGLYPVMKFMDCDCGYIYAEDRVTDGECTTFVRKPGYTGTVMIDGELDDIVLNEKQTQRIVDTKLVYAKRAKGKFFYNDSNHRQAICHIEQTGNLVIATELKENKGMSVTNACNTIAAKYAEFAGIALEDLVFVERHDERSHGYSRAALERVSFKIVNEVHKRSLREPNWTPITEKQLESLRRKAMF